MTQRFGPAFQRFLHNSAAQTFGQGVNVVQQILLVSAFLRAWSIGEYGEWIIITSIPSVLWTLDNGLSGLAGNRMTVAAGSGDWARANLIFHNVLFIQGVLSAVILLVIGSYCAFGDVSAMFSLKIMARHEAGEILFVMILYMLLGYGLGLLRATFRASMLEARGVGLLNLQKLSELIVQIGTLAAGFHAVGVAVAMLGNMFVWIVLGAIDARRRCPLITWSFGPLDLAQAKSMLIDGLPVFANSAANALFLQGYPNIVNHLLGSSAVVFLTTVRTGSRTLLQVVGIVNNASGSELSRTYGSKDWDAYLRILKVLIITTVGASAVAAIGLTLFGPWVILKWTAGKVIVSHQIMFLFAISVACQCCWLACGGVLFSTNMHHVFNYTYLVLTVVGLSVVGWAIHVWGFAGVPMVMVAADAVLLGWVLYICRLKLAFISLASLGRIFSPAFYFEKGNDLVRHMTGKGKAA